MWCPQCHRETSARPDGNGLRCALCRGAFAAVGSGQPLETRAKPRISAKGGETPSAPALEDWDTDEDLRRARLLLARWDEAHGAGQESTPQRRAEGFSLSWLVVCLGAAGLAFGGALMGLSLWQGRQELWGPGLLGLVVGQTLFLLGMLGRIERGADAEKDQSADEPARDPHSGEPLWRPATQSALRTSIQREP